MSHIIAAATWTLITVTSAGAVNHSPPFATLHMCDEAMSLATTGRTIEAEAKRVADVKAAALKATAEWDAAHPWREPKDDREKAIAGTDYNQLYHIGENVESDGHGHVREVRAQMYLSSSNSLGYSTNRINVAECVIEEPKP